MSSHSEGDVEERPSSGDQDGRPVLATSRNRMSMALSTSSTESIFRPFPRPLVLFNSHECQKNLDAFLSANPDTAANIVCRCANLGDYLTCTRNNVDGAWITENTLDLLISCAGCISQLCMVTVVKTEDLNEDVLSKFYTATKEYNVATRSLFEAVLFRATTADLSCFYGNTGGPVDFPCVNHNLCGCLIRPLYAAIYFSNAWMVSTLLRYGAEVRPEDRCQCEEPRRIHPLLRVYAMLAGGATDGLRNTSTSANVVRCHKLAALVMPCHDAADVRDACYTLVRALTPSTDFQTLMREKGSLRHLCRLSLRAALTRRRAMPEGVGQLPLPKKLQRYILYQYGPGSV